MGSKMERQRRLSKGRLYEVVAFNERCPNEHITDTLRTIGLNLSGVLKPLLTIE